MDPVKFSGALDAIYSAAIAFEEWPTAMSRLGELFDCSCVNLIDRNLRTLEGRVSAIGVDDSGQREFATVWTERNVFRQKTRVWRPGLIETDQDILPRSELLRSDYYNGFLNLRDMQHTMRITLGVEDDLVRLLTFNRPTVAGEFESSDVELCRLFVSHLQRAIHVNLEMAKTKVILGAATEVLEQSSVGVLLLGDDGRIAFINRAGRSMAAEADGFIIVQDRIKALRARDNDVLQRLIRGALGRLAVSDVARGGVMRSARRSGKLDFAIVVGRVPVTHGYPAPAGAAFILITDPLATPVRSEEMLKLFFDLSTAELRVARCLVQGQGPEQAAATLNIQVSTARWHLASLFRKTGTNRQAELVRTLLSLSTP